MDEIMSFTPENEESKRKRPVWQVVAIVSAVVLAVAAFLWLVIDPFAKPFYATFEGSTVVVSEDESNNGKPLSIEPEAKISMRDGTPIPLTVTLVKADLRDMTVTVMFNKSLYRDDEAVDRVTFCYDETVMLTTSTQADAQTLYFFVMLPQVIRELRGDSDPVTCLAGEGTTVRLYDHYYAWHYGKTAEEVSYGTYTKEDDTLILTEQAGLTRYVFQEKDGVYTYDRRASYRHDRAHTPSLHKGDTLRFLYAFERAHDAASDRYTYSVLNYAGEVLVGGVTEHYSNVGAKLVEPDLLCVSASQVTAQTVVGRSMVALPLISEDEMLRGTAQYIDLNSGACSEVYENVRCTTDGGIAHVVTEDGQAAVVYEPIPFCDHPIPKALTVPLEGVTTVADVDVQVYAENGRLIVDYKNGEKRTVTVLNEDGTPCTDPLVTAGDTLREYEGVAFFTVVDHTAIREILLFGVRSAYVYRDGVYLPLSDAFTDAEDLYKKVLVDIEAGIATRTSWENGAGFTAHYGDDRHTITVAGEGEDHDVYVGVIPTAEQVDNMLTQYNYR